MLLHHDYIIIYHYYYYYTIIITFAIITQYDKFIIMYYYTNNLFTQLQRGDQAGSAHTAKGTLWLHHCYVITTSLLKREIM